MAWVLATLLFLVADAKTWYRPHATETHYAFPISLGLWNTLLMDMNSVFQAILCVCVSRRRFMISSGALKGAQHSLA